MNLYVLECLKQNLIVLKKNVCTSICINNLLCSLTQEIMFGIYRNSESYRWLLVYDINLTNGGVVKTEFFKIVTLAKFQEIMH